MKRKLARGSITDLVLPGDWKARLASENVRRLADSGEILQPPAVRAADKSVIWGGDRLAAMHLRGSQRAEWWVIDCDEDEAADMRDVENAFRREPDLAARQRLVDRSMARLEARVRATEDADDAADAPGNSRTESAKAKRGRPPSPEGVARAEVAAAAGVSKNALEKQASRERAKVGAQAATNEAKPTPVVDGSAPPPSPEMTPGLDVLVALDEIDKHLTAAVTLVTKLAKSHPELVERFPMQDLKWKLQRDVAPGFRAMRPAGRCVYCKLVPSEQPNCAGCKGSGWLTDDATRDAPPELLIVGEGEGIFVEGKFVTLVELAERTVRGSKVGTKKSAGGVKAVPAEGRAVVEESPKSGGTGEAAALPPRVTKRQRHVDIRLVDEAGNEASWEEPWTDTK